MSWQGSTRGIAEVRPDCTATLPGHGITPSPYPVIWSNSCVWSLKRLLLKSNAFERDGLKITLLRLKRAE